MSMSDTFRDAVNMLINDTRVSVPYFTSDGYLYFAFAGKNENYTARIRTDRKRVRLSFFYHHPIEPEWLDEGAFSLDEFEDVIAAL